MKSSNNKQSNFSSVKWILKRTKRCLPVVFLIAFLAIAVSLSSIYLAVLSKDLLDVATKNATGNIWSLGALLLGIVLFQIVSLGLETFLKTFASAKLTVSLRSHFFKVVAKRKYSEITEYHSGDFLNRFTSDTDVIISSVVNIIPNVSSMISKLVGGIITMLVLDKRIAIIIVSAGILVPAFGRIVNRKFKELHKRCQKSEGQTRSFLQECFENIVVLKTFNSEDSLSHKLTQYLNVNYRLKIKRGAISLITHLLLYAMFTIGYYVVMLWGADQIATGAITYGTLTAFLQLVQQLRAPLQNVSGILPQYYSALASAERLIEIETGSYDIPPQEKQKLAEIKANFSGIEFKNIDFAYKDELILKNCNFKLPSGKITAITGESGSGKSTLFKIILSLYEPQEGKIFVNGDVELDSSLRGLFAYVPQGNMVLSGTIRENITLCNDSIGDEKIIKAAKTAEIYDLIESLPDGLDTVLSERGGGLSEGQIQRISIARALLTDAPVLLLDEATSALDEPTETKVLDNIKSLKDKTVMFVTHRNTSLKVCDRIININNKQFSLIKE